MPNSVAILTNHAEAPKIVLDGPLSGLTHQTILGASLGSLHASLWQHHMTEPLVVPAHFHEVEETVVVLSGCLRFVVGPNIDDWDGKSDPLENALITDCGPDATFQVPARTLHGYEITGVPARVLIFMPDSTAKTSLPDGSAMPLPWA